MYISKQKYMYTPEETCYILLVKLLGRLSQNKIYKVQENLKHNPHNTQINWRWKQVVSTAFRDLKELFETRQSAKLDDILQTVQHVICKSTLEHFDCASEFQFKLKFKDSKFDILKCNSETTIYDLNKLNKWDFSADRILFDR